MRCGNHQYCSHDRAADDNFQQVQPLETNVDQAPAQQHAQTQREKKREQRCTGCTDRTPPRNEHPVQQDVDDCCDSENHRLLPSFLGQHEDNVVGIGAKGAKGHAYGHDGSNQCRLAGHKIAQEQSCHGRREHDQAHRGRQSKPNEQH